MRLGAYLRSIWWGILLALLLVTACAFILTMTSASRGVVFIVCGLILGFTLGVLAVDYLRKRSFYRELECCVQDPDRVLWSSDLLDRPDHLEGRLAYDALRAVAKSANDAVAASRRQTTEYREYIETWVHEAKSPLAAAHLMIENIEDGLSAVDACMSDPATLLSRMEALDEELDRMEGFVEQALFYARSEAVDRDYLIREYSLESLVNGAVRANSRMLISARVAPSFHNLGYRVFTDEKWVLFILGQIIQNSVKYASTSGARIDFGGALLNQGAADECVELVIRDNGCGVPAADLPRVFEKGFTGAAGRTGKRSTGIGLYLVKNLCTKMGVGIRADSQEGRGFAVTLSFPTNKFHYFE